MARRIQGFVMRKMYKHSITHREVKRKSFKPLADAVFKFDKNRDKDLLRKLFKAREKITKMLINRSIVFSCKAFGGSLTGMKKTQDARARTIVKKFIQSDALSQGFFRKSIYWLQKMYAV